MKKEELLKEIGHGTTIVKFHAEWCQPCKVVSNTLKNVLEAKPEIKLIEIDVDKEPELTQEYNIKNIPTLLIYRDNILVNKLTGTVTGMAIYQSID